MVKASAHAEGFTLVGWAGLQDSNLSETRLVQEGLEMLFGYEEAIRYVFGYDIRNKHGVSANVSEP